MAAIVFHSHQQYMTVPISPHPNSCLTILPIAVILVDMKLLFLFIMLLYDVGNLMVSSEQITLLVSSEQCESHILCST